MAVAKYPKGGLRSVPGKTTLADLFPTNISRMQYTRVLLMLMEPGLLQKPWDEPLDRALLEKIEWAIQQDEKG